LKLLVQEVALALGSLQPLFMPGSRLEFTVLEPGGNLVTFNNENIMQMLAYVEGLNAAKPGTPG
jgi:hypothetical protein